MPNNGPKRPVLQWLILFTICTTPATAQQAAKTAPGLSVDLSRHYFKAPQEELAARDELNAALGDLERLRAQLDSAPHLLAFLEQKGAVQKLFAKHDDYLYLRCSLNRKDPACEEEDKLDSEFHAKKAFFEPAILAIPDDRLRSFMSREPKLKQYSFELSDIRRNAPHLLPEPQQRFLDELRAEITDWQYDLYGQIIEGIKFGAVETPAGPLDVIRQRNLIASSADAHVREEGFKKRYAGYASQRELIAFALLHTIRSQQALAKAHHFADAPLRKYESLYFKPEQTRNLLALLAQHGDVPKRYEKIRSHEIEQSNHQPAHVWDMSAPATGFTPPITSLPEARNVFHEAFAGLGKEYQSAFDALLDPANGRADILPGGAPNRYGGGFSLGLGGKGILFYGRYDGTFKDLSVIAHEGGHATHRELMNANHVLPCSSADLTSYSSHSRNLMNCCSLTIWPNTPIHRSYNAIIANDGCTSKDSTRSMGRRMHGWSKLSTTVLRRARSGARMTWIA